MQLTDYRKILVVATVTAVLGTMPGCGKQSPKPETQKANPAPVVTAKKPVALPPATAAKPAGSAELIASQTTAGKVDISLQNEAKAAIQRGLKWLASHQKENGAWSNEDFPALTALPLWAFSWGEHPDKDKITSNAVAFILGSVQADGGIYRNVEAKGGGLANYNTAICMTGLHATGKPELGAVVRKAREFVAAGQHTGDDVYNGGMGYDKATGRQYADLSDTVIAVEAMRFTQSAEDNRPAGEKRADLKWQGVTQFLGHVQNDASTGPSNAGGFAYRPEESKAGTTTNADGTVVFRSYGSMTYAGLLTLIYADVDRKDPRVRSAFEWTVRHWTLNENPGMGQEGLYYFYNVLTKALSAYGQDMITREDGTKLDWRTEVVRKLINLQKIDPATGEGYWINDAGRWWEADPVLTTSYVLIALEAATR